MKKLLKRMHGGQKGFTLIELLVVIAILGVIAAVVALNVAGFFGRGTLQAANTELHQAQTAIIAAMADAETNVIEGEDFPIYWSGESEFIEIVGTDGETYDASTYVYGPFRATYMVDSTGAIVGGCSDGRLTPDCTFCAANNPWGHAIFWSQNDNWTDDETQGADYVEPEPIIP